MAERFVSNPNLSVRVEKLVPISPVEKLPPEKVTLPWPIYAYDHARKVMGEDYWPYGAHENKLPLETLARYSFQQGLSVRQIALDEMFAKPTYELSKI